MDERGVDVTELSFVILKISTTFLLHLLIFSPFPSFSFSLFFRSYI